VVQTGARRGYAVPAILERAGMLDRFYTDACADVGLGRWLASARKLPVIGPRFARLAGRRLPPEIRAKTRTFFRRPPGWLTGRQGLDDEVFRRAMHEQRRWSRSMARAGFGQATHLYSMLNEAGELIGLAKERGLKVVSEVYVLLDTERLLMEERRAFPGWEDDVPDRSRAYREFGDFGLIEQTDLFICPSGAVRDDLLHNRGVAEARTVVVPYGMDPRWLELEPAPRPGRILFVGTAELRKGIHYLAQAAEMLAARGRRYEFRVAGHVTPRVAGQAVCRQLNFLGRVPRERIHEEFQAADLVVLPSLAEGSAEVTYEALASGLPVVVTPAAGSVARDGIEGRVVPERDAAALADAIEGIVEDRPRREAMAAAARARARDYTWERYGERLVAALRTRG
jgi:glycosyltransferase involved in cell wall biosynthesis